MNKFIRSLFFLSVFVLGFSMISHGQARQTHTVQAGETLFSISRQYDVPVDSLRAWNDFDENSLSVGQSIVVGQATQATGNRAEGGTTHTVERQETLFSISKQYGVTISELKQWNNLSNNNLEVGQQLTIYPPENQGASSQQNQTLVVNTPSRSNTYYTVKSGDTLYEIAQQHAMTVNELKSLNDLSSNTIRIGQRLTVRKTTQAAPSVAENAEDSTPQGAFVVHRVQSGTTLNSLLNEYKMTEEEFRALNPDISSDVETGQNVTVLLPSSSSYSNPYKVNSGLKSLGQTPVSSYPSNQAGTTTTSGELYDPDQLTAAHSNIALGTVIFVKNPGSNKGVFVRINDRFSGNGLKLSSAVISTLELPTQGNATVNMYQNQ